MPVWWWLLVTIHLVCGNEEHFEDLYGIDVNPNIREEDTNEDVIESVSSYIPETELSRKKRSLLTEEREKRQPKFHSWGGKRYEEDEEESNREDGILNNMSYNFIQLPEGKSEYDEEFMTKHTKRMKEKPAFSSWAGKRDPEVIHDIEKKSNLYNSILQQEFGKSFSSEPNSKRYPAFNSWAGKRAAAFNSWGGKRAASFNSWGGKRQEAPNTWEGKRTAAFSSWGGKREAPFNSREGKKAAAFNSWGGKRTAAFNSWGGKRAAAFNSWGGKRAAAFNSWGGKRAAAFNSWGGKRTTAFNSWGGKRAAAFNSWGGKRAAAFNSWGGKRVASFNSWGGKRDAFRNPQNTSIDNEDDNLSLQNGTNLSGSNFNYETMNNINPNRPFDHKISALFDRTEFLNFPSKLQTNDNLKISSIIPIEDSVSVNQPHNNRNEQISENENDFNEVQPDDNILFQYNYHKYPALVDHARLNKREENDYFNIQSRYPGFSSWAGKRNDQSQSKENILRPIFTTMIEKRNPLFSNWYGNKIPTVQLSNGKRRPAFSSWGGKRSEYKKQEECLDCSLTKLHESNIPDLTDFEESVTNIQASEEKDVLRKKRDTTCGVGSCRDKRSNGNVKKNPAMTRMLLHGGVAWPLLMKSLPRGTDFYAWGGKRSS